MRRGTVISRLAHLGVRTFRELEGMEVQLREDIGTSGGDLFHKGTVMRVSSTSGGFLHLWLESSGTGIRKSRGVRNVRPKLVEPVVEPDLETPDVDSGSGEP